MKEDRDPYAELGRVGAGHSPELYRLLERFQDEGRDSKKLVEELRSYVAGEFEVTPTTNQVGRFARAAAQAAGMPEAARQVWITIKACEKAEAPSGGDDDDDPGADFQNEITPKRHRDDDQR